MVSKALTPICLGITCLGVVCLLLWQCSKPEDAKKAVPPPAHDRQAPIDTPPTDVRLPEVEGDLESLFENTDSNATEKPEDEENGFLASDFEPLDQWFDERFKLEYKSQTPQRIFNQVPINDINFELDDRISDQSFPKFNLTSDSMSRRELLQKIGDFWDLKMVIVSGDDNGAPTAVRVMPID